MKKGKTINDILVFVLLSVIGASMLVPFGWMLLSSLRDKTEFFRDISGLLPTGPHWSNYVQAWTAMPFGHYFVNSVIVAVAVTLGQLITSSFAAYAFARLRFRGREWLFRGYLSTMMVPAQVTLIPLFIIMVKFHWLDSYLALVVPFLAGAYGCFLLRQFFLTIPQDLEDAAMIDGAGHWSIFLKIILPLSKPALAAFGKAHSFPEQIIAYNNNRLSGKVDPFQKPGPEKYP